MATSTRSDAYNYKQENYSTVAAASVVTKTFTPALRYLLINNTDTANDASISLDGTTFLTIKHGTALELFPAALGSYKVKDAVDNSHATLQCLYGSESAITIS